MIKSIKARQIMLDTVVEGVNNMADEITAKMGRFSEKLQNGGGEALIELLSPREKH